MREALRDIEPDEDVLLSLCASYSSFATTESFDQTLGKVRRELWRARAREAVVRHFGLSSFSQAIRALPDLRALVNRAVAAESTAEIITRDPSAMARQLVAMQLVQVQADPEVPDLRRQAAAMHPS